MKLCRHCGKSKPNRPRGLCFRCYYTRKPDGTLLRFDYPPTSKFGFRSHPDKCGRVPLADRPTGAAPGSLEKQLVMEQRAKAGVSIFHPDDQPLDLSRLDFDAIDRSRAEEYTSSKESEGKAA